MFNIEINNFDFCEICNSKLIEKQIGSVEYTYFCKVCEYYLFKYDFGLNSISCYKQSNHYEIWEDLHYHKNGKEKFGFSING